MYLIIFMSVKMKNELQPKTGVLESNDNPDRSWWYNFCLKCRTEEVQPSWQPAVWSQLCPYPFCPTYRQFSRLSGITLIGVMSWVVVYSIIGDEAAPNGRIFQLILLSASGYFGGWLFSLTTLPQLCGMLAVGMLFQNLGVVDIDDDFKEITNVLRKIALVVILTRAGLGLDIHSLKQLKYSILVLCPIPWIVEVSTSSMAYHYFLGLPWSWTFMLSVVVAAISPAVVVPGLLRLRSEGYGVVKKIPTLIIAVASIDDAISVAMFGIMKSIMFLDDSLTFQILQVPISLFGGIGFAALWGILTNYIPEHNDPYNIPLRVFMALVGGLVSIFGSELIKCGGAGPVGCVGAAFVSMYFWSKNGWKIENNPAAIAFRITWRFLEPILFSITGAQIKFNELDGSVVLIGIGILLACIVIRVLITILAGMVSDLNYKEKMFVAFAWMSKATVQAALGPVALTLVAANTPEYEYAKKVLTICILSIVLTAPTGAILITVFGPRLLQRDLPDKNKTPGLSQNSDVNINELT